MAAPPTDRPGRREIRQVHGRLRRHYGSTSRRSAKEPILDSLIATVLSQATTDLNSSRAFASLKERFADWDEARRASIPAIQASDQLGKIREFEDLSGPEGLLLLFFRTVDW